MHVTSNGNKIIANKVSDLIKGIKPSRDDFDDTTSTSPTNQTAVPKSGGTTAPQPN